MNRAGLVGSGIIQSHEEETFPGVGIPVVVQVVVAFESKKVSLTPPVVLLAASKLIMDIDQVGDGGALKAVDGVAEGVVVAFFHPGVFARRPADLALGQVVAGEVNHRDANPGEDVGVGKLQLRRGAFIMAVGEHDSLLGAETRKAREGGEVSIIEGIVHHSLFAGEIEIAGFDAPVGVGGIPPIIDFTHPANEELGIDQGAIPANVVLVHLVKIHPLDCGVGGASQTTLLKVALDVVDEGLVTEAFGLVGKTKEVFVDMFRSVKAHPIVVHGVTQPVDPAGDELTGILRQISGLVEVGVFFGIPGVTDERGGINSISDRVGTTDLKAIVELQDDVHQADEFLMQGASGAVSGVPKVHAIRPFEAAGLGGVGPNVKILRNHAWVGAKVWAVAGVVEDDVGVNFDVRLVGVIHEVAEGGAGAVAGFPVAALRGVTQIEPVKRVVANVAPVSIGVRSPNRRLAGGRSPDGFVTNLGHLRKALIYLVPAGLKILDDDLGMAQTGEDRKGEGGAGEGFDEKPSHGIIYHTGE